MIPGEDGMTLLFSAPHLMMLAIHRLMSAAHPKLLFSGYVIVLLIVAQSLLMSFCSVAVAVAATAMSKRTG